MKKKEPFLFLPLLSLLFAFNISLLYVQLYTHYFMIMYIIIKSICNLIKRGARIIVE